MLLPEFYASVKSGNLLRTKIMLKDSLIVDPTFIQFDEMLAYARCELPVLLEVHDGEILEDNESQWNIDLMNKELVEIVNNFSEVRINHLKKVISVVLADKIRKNSTVNSASNNQGKPRTQQDYKYQNGSIPYHLYQDNERQKVEERKRALSQITNNSKRIESIMDGIHSNGKWRYSDIQELEKAAYQMLYAIRIYKKNR